MLAKRVAVFAASLRGRPLDEKAAIVRSTREHVWPLLAAGRVRAGGPRDVPAGRRPRRRTG